MSTISDSPVDAIPLAEAALLFPKRNGKSPTVATLKRRIKVGVGGVRLYGFRSGAMWFTTREAIDGFHRELAKRNQSERAVPSRASNRAAKEYLQRLGIGSGGKNKKDV